MYVNCLSCRDQTPTLRAIYADLKDQGFQIIAVAIIPNDSAQELEDYREELELGWPHGLYDSGAVGDYTVRGTPTLALVDRDGNLAGKWTGVRSEGQLRAAIEPLL